jgi:tetratricopeptide (TPR) repeat protein
MSQPPNPSNNLPTKILVVDDDPTIAQGLDGPLSRYNIKVDRATTLETALYLFNTQRYDVVLVEIEFAPLPGLALIQKWRAHEVSEKRCTAFIVLSGNKTLGNNEGLVRELGDIEVLNKPCSAVQVLPFLSRGLATKKRLVAYAELKSKVINFYEKTHDFAKAAEQVQKRLPELGPKGLTVLYDLYEKANRFDDALAIVGPMLDRDPNNIALLNAKGRLLMRLGRFAEAKACLAKSDELAPQNIERLNELATAYLHLKDPENSVKRFREILSLSPEKPELKFEMFSRLYEHGFDEQAVAFGKETAKPMEIVRHYNNKGVMLSKDGNNQGALSEYKRALQFFPQFKENYRIYYNIALAHLQQKTKEAYEIAHKNLKHCLSLEPQFDKARKTLEQVERQLEGWKKAG